MLCGNFQTLRCCFVASSEHRDTEAFESVVEDEQLPQVVDELHDLYLSPGAPNAKMSVRVKGQMRGVLWNTIMLDVVMWCG